VFRPAEQSVASYVKLHGRDAFYSSVELRKQCCEIRKVEPLGRALAGLAAWMTGRRAEQSVTRTATPEVEVDDVHGGIAKLNPIIHWSMEEVRAYADKHRVPIHPLLDRGYPSIGCAPCTRAIRPGEHPRAGRWWWENPENKECGIHVGGEPVAIAATK
jgi:phosphoadenosine phosphosulfate reductase